MSTADATAGDESGVGYDRNQKKKKQQQEVINNDEAIKNSNDDDEEEECTGAIGNITELSDLPLAIMASYLDIKSIMSSDLSCNKILRRACQSAWERFASSIPDNRNVVGIRDNSAKKRVLLRANLHLFTDRMEKAAVGHYVDATSAYGCNGCQQLHDWNNHVFTNREQYVFFIRISQGEYVDGSLTFTWNTIWEGILPAVDGGILWTRSRYYWYCPSRCRTRSGRYETELDIVAGFS